MDKIIKPGEPNVSAISRNLISGFSTTGIYPSDKNKVLYKIPTVNANENPTVAVNDVLTNYLRQKRFGDTNATPRVRRKKSRLNIEPEHAENSTGSEEEDNDDIIYTTPKKRLVKSNTFVLVKFLSGKRKCTIYKYACVVDEVLSESEYNVTGLKSKKRFLGGLFPLKQALYNLDLWQE
ncbi:hypothetical protein ILUMI_13031 [Ignelater luminosus]|uniref:Uncharacterized protein n=1 Tax=Ignelater luminosus TaxID=2038154 RepID=A0A8K0G912_IGNLU|nr:hypothetical protein ILUMI_13031 [Ignelater luminosus]